MNMFDSLLVFIIAVSLAVADVCPYANCVGLAGNNQCDVSSLPIM